jgi:pyruvate-formate lyase-activating enzyme
VNAAAEVDCHSVTDTLCYDGRVVAFHVTVLSNFARAYDKYARVYDKGRIAESTYPDAFYVLGEHELGIGVAKARRLLDRLALAGDALIALRTEVAELTPNLRNGRGQVYASPRLPMEGVFALDGEALGARLEIEDVMARSLAIHAGAFAPYGALRPRSISFLPIARGCQAACAFCFSESSVSAEQRQGKLDVQLAARWLAAAAARGAERAVITGGGEPTLWKWPALLELVRACRARLGKVVLITNGVVLADDPDTRVRELHDAGLGVLAVSRHHRDEARNASLMKLATGTPRVIGAAARAGLRARLVCVLQRGGVDSVAAIDDYVQWAAAIGADEVCFKELYVSTSHESLYHSHAANAWSAQHQVPLAHVLAWAAAAGFRVAHRLPWGAPVLAGHAGGRAIQVAAYTEPSLFWERSHGIARSWNVMADGSCLASLEDRASRIEAP